MRDSLNLLPEMSAKVGMVRDLASSYPDLLQPYGGFLDSTLLAAHAADKVLLITKFD